MHRVTGLLRIGPAALSSSGFGHMTLLRANGLEQGIARSPAGQELLLRNECWVGLLSIPYPAPHHIPHGNFLERGGPPFQILPLATSYDLGKHLKCAKSQGDLSNEY